jgi:hypothetical protein
MRGQDYTTINDEELQKIADEVWQEAESLHLTVESDYEERQKRAFGVTCLIGVGILLVIAVFYFIMS